MPALAQRDLDLERDHVHGRAAGVGRRDGHLDLAVAHLDVAQHAEIGDGEHRDLRVHHLGDRAPGELAQGLGAGSGCGCVTRWLPDRCAAGTAAGSSRWPRCSLWRPLRPPLCIQDEPGAVSVASPSTSRTVLDQAARKLSGSTATPCSISPRSAASTSNSSPRVRPQLVHGGLGACVALVGAVAEADHPFRRVAQMVGALLLRLGGDGRERGVLGRHHGAPVGIGEGGIEQLADDGVGEVAVGLLDQQQVPVLVGVAQVGVLVLVVAGPLDLGGVGVEQARLPDQVEPDVGERHVLLQHRRTSAPLRQPVAEDEDRPPAAARRAPEASPTP